MAFRLIGTIEDRQVDLVLPLGRLLLGADPSCDLCLSHPSVSRNHAEIISRESAIEVVDLGSKNGTFIARKRVHRAEVQAGASLRFGGVTLLLEEVDSADFETALKVDELPAAEPVEAERGPFATTVSHDPMSGCLQAALARILAQLEEGVSVIRAAQQLGHTLYELLPVCALAVTGTLDGEQIELFRVDDAVSDASSGRTEVSHGSFTISAAVTDGEALARVTPLLEISCWLLCLVDTMELEPVPSSPPAAVQLPEPATVNELMRRLYEEAAHIALSDVGILLRGESGTGKEVLASFIHRSSPKADGPFVAINCAALPRDLLETELFGIERGVATGVEMRAGKIELADGGTLFLDEIGDMAVETQAMILRTLQEREVYRIGAAKPRRVMVRVISATNKDLDRLITEGGFREDLYFRIAAWRTVIPPLRSRRDDIPNLAAFFVAREARRLDKRVRGISRAALDALLAFDWPGNVRQLENEMARAVALTRHGGMLDSQRLSPEVLAGPLPRQGGSLADRLAVVERQEIRKALEQCGGDTIAAGELLGMSRSTLYRRMHQLEIPGTFRRRD